jgi:hypothetical protein
MDDVIDAHQGSFRLGPQQPVRVRNDSNPERHLPAASTTIAKRRSRSSTCPDSIFVRANSISNHSAPVDFGKALPSTASWRPFNIEGIAAQRRRVKMALSGECDDALPSSLSNLPQGLERTNRRAMAEFLGKLAPRDQLRSIRGIDFALRNGPSAIILLVPEGTAGMNEQNLEPASALAVCENARAQQRSPGSLF